MYTFNSSCTHVFNRESQLNWRSYVKRQTASKGKNMLYNAIESK